MTKFHQHRRQQFLDESAYHFTHKFLKEEALPMFVETLKESDNDVDDRRRVSAAIADATFVNFMLKFTAGESLDSLRNELTEVIAAFELATKFVREYASSPTYPPLRFIEIDEYERTMQLIGLSYLLHRRDLLARIAAMLDGAGAGEDTLYEDLLSFELAGRYEVEEWYHDVPYGRLIDSFYRDTAEERIADIDKYLKGWYMAMAKAPWFDGHVDIGPHGCGAYFGYWAVEAAAAVYLLDIDDRSFREHLVYPKDLVDYARRLDSGPPTSESLSSAADLSGLRVEGGSPCPRTGYWVTPAKADSRQHFIEGATMPEFKESAYGATIWQWSNDQ